jgi:hypothetical protein
VILFGFSCFDASVIVVVDTGAGVGSRGAGAGVASVFLPQTKLIHLFLGGAGRVSAFGDTLTRSLWTGAPKSASLTSTDAIEVGGGIGFLPKEYGAKLP